MRKIIILISIITILISCNNDLKLINNMGFCKIVDIINYNDSTNIIILTNHKYTLDIMVARDTILKKGMFVLPKCTDKIGYIRRGDFKN